MHAIDDFHTEAQLAVLALALIVLAARVAWAVWRSLLDERRVESWGGFMVPMTEHYSIRVLPGRPRPYDLELDEED